MGLPRREPQDEREGGEGEGEKRKGGERQRKGKVPRKEGKRWADGEMRTWRGGRRGREEGDKERGMKGRTLPIWNEEEQENAEDADSAVGHHPGPKQLPPPGET